MFIVVLGLCCVVLCCVVSCRVVLGLSCVRFELCCGCVVFIVVFVLDLC
jgi:hypothetical protein